MKSIRVRMRDGVFLACVTKTGDGWDVHFEGSVERGKPCSDGKPPAYRAVHEERYPLELVEVDADGNLEIDASTPRFPHAFIPKRR